MEGVLEARRLSVLGRDRVLLREVSLTLGRGELVALIGPSGAGKTTFLRALSGSGPLHSGVVELAEPNTQQRYGIGYVPSEDPLHDELTVDEELFFAAALRGAADADADAVDATVLEVLEDLQLADQRQQRIASLSRGERRRVSLAVELVGQPDVLLLDEPGSGLDAGLERRMMRLLRRQADGGRSILAATHATASLTLCDRVAVIGRGGDLRYVGRVEELLEHFEVDSIEGVYERLEDPEPGDRPPTGTVGGDIEMIEVQRPSALGPPPWFGRQLSIVAERSLLCRLRDRRALLLLVGQAPVLGLIIGLVLPRGSLSNSTLGPYYEVLIAFLLLTGSIWLGTIAACRDIVGELASVRQETAIGLRLDVYMAAKCLTLFPVVVLQTGLFALVVEVLQPPPQGALGVGIACVATGIAAASFGLWLSAAARNTDIAVGATPLIMIPQLVLAGALIPLSDTPAPFRVIADVLVGRWSFDALGSALGLNGSLGSSLSSVSGLSATSFSAQPTLPVLLCLALALISVIMAAAALDRRLRTTT